MAAIATCENRAYHLLPGDIIVWDKAAQSILVYIQGEADKQVRWSGGADTKYMYPGINSQPEFKDLAILIAATHGLLVKPAMEFSRPAYEFIRPQKGP